MRSSLPDKHAAVDKLMHTEYSRLLSNCRAEHVKIYGYHHPFSNVSKAQLVEWWLENFYWSTFNECWCPIRAKRA